MQPTAELRFVKGDTVLVDARSFCEQILKYRISQLDDTEKQQRQKISAHPSQMEQPAEDEIIRCTRYNEDGTKCNATFTFTVDEQQAYLSTYVIRS